MFIPSKWKCEAISDYTDAGGASPAEIIKFKSNNEWLYSKSIDSRYLETTFSVKREKDVMRWLNGKLNVPRVIDSGFENDREFFIMSELNGIYIDEIKTDPEAFVRHLVNCIRLFQSVDISDCPFDSSLKVRLAELDYLLKNGLASTGDWDSTTKFTDVNEFYQWLCDYKPQEEFVFSHGDLTANVFVDGAQYNFYDLGRAGIADKWLDIAFCVSDIRTWTNGNKKYEDMFFELLNIQPNYKKIEYFLLLDEMF